MSSDLNAFIKELTRKGWKKRIRSNNHIQLTHESGRSLITSSTASDVRAIRNARAEARRIERGSKGG